MSPGSGVAVMLKTEPVVMNAGMTGCVIVPLYHNFPRHHFDTCNPAIM